VSDDALVPRSPVPAAAMEAAAPPPSITLRPDEARTKPRSPRAARAELDRTRQEIRDTLDVLKSRVQTRRNELRSKLDVVNTVRDRIYRDPLLALGAALGAGFLVGLITGGEERPRDGGLTEDEIEEIRAFRAERRRHLRRMEKIMEDTARGRAPTFRERVRERFRRDREEDR